MGSIAPEMHVSHETIYLSLFVQSRGELRRELHHSLRTGRAMRRSKQRPAIGSGKIPGMVMMAVFARSGVFTYQPSDP